MEARRRLGAIEEDLHFHENSEQVCSYVIPAFQGLSLHHVNHVSGAPF